MKDRLDKALWPLWEKVAAGERLSAAEGVLLFETRDLLGVGRLAELARARRGGRDVFYIKNQHLNYSNVCTVDCDFCAFSARSGEGGAYQQSRDEILARAEAGAREGAREFHIVGGCHSALSLDWHCELLGALRERFPEVVRKAFTAVEIACLAEREGCSIEEALRRLIAAGLQFIPGGGAEIFSERVRDEICPRKPRAETWLAVHRAAHGLGVRSNATLLFGHVETAEERVDHLLRLRELQDETGGFVTFIPLRFHPENTRLEHLPLALGELSLRCVAAGRLLLDNFARVKAYWPMLGLKVAQTALFFGADDLDGTIAGERISHAAGARTPTALGVPELRRLIEETGRRAVERDSWGAAVDEIDGMDDEGAGGGGGAARMAALVGGILEEAGEGRRLTDEEALLLFESRDLLALGGAADAARWRRLPERQVTYIVDRNINYTNICTVGCGFCAFNVPAEEGERGYVLGREELGRKFEETVALGGTQVLMQGGCHPTLRLGWYEDLLRWAKANYPLRMHCFSPPEIVHFARLNRLPERVVLERLMAAGLDSLPGGGAEILSDRVRGEVSPRKCTADEWIGVMRAAHELGLTTSATMMFGHVETCAERVEHLRRVRELQDETGGFVAFIPWTFQAANTALAHVLPAGACDYLKTLAISRLYLDNFRNVQASWVTQGRELCQVGLHFGANDVGSTMIEENVVRAAGCAHRLAEEDLRALIRETGNEPLQRDFYYQPVER